jgi:hypothetical protein
MSNPVIFVSLGPGEPDLITLKGLKALQNADCIFCPETRTTSGQIFSRAADILHALDIPDTTLSRFELPMSKNREQAFSAYDKVYNEAFLLHQNNKKVCIVAEGDAGFYSSVHYIFEKLQADNIPVQHIAGIPAFIAAGACAGLHIASQEERLTVIPGIITAEEIEKYMEEKTTIVIMKLSQCTEEIHRCIHLHPEYNYHYFENIGTEKEKFLHDIELISALSFPYFSLLIIRHSTF